MHVDDVMCIRHACGGHVTCMWTTCYMHAACILHDGMRTYYDMHEDRACGRLLATLHPHSPLFHTIRGLAYFFFRQAKLEESLLYQQFLVGVDEEESWMNEKTALVSSDEVGDTLAAVQVSQVLQH